VSRVSSEVTSSQIIILSELVGVVLVKHTVPH
jgi:hypothetical protein